ncbi:MAG: alpha/beta fold hydrolase [Streptosporangiales bacterium]|nr:alpha/beta fold hydrolase [Streptosporangiales bacterium]MBO0890290.1 alpha/beta fold hydrolase [Acidothermales bacterium]
MKAELGDATLHYEVIGEGPDVLLSHGVIENSSSWDDVVARLAERFRVTCYDARGRGGSGGGDTPFGFAELAEDVEALARHLGLVKFVHVGHSMGGRVALEHAVRHPRRLAGLVVASARAEAPSAAGRSRLEALIESVRAEGSGAGVDMWTSPADDYYARAREISEANPVPGTTRALATLVAMDSFVPRLGSVDVPVLVVAGDRDVDYLHSAEVMAERIPVSSLRVLPGVGHFPNLQCPAAFADQVIRFAETGLRGQAQR